MLVVFCQITKNINVEFVIDLIKNVLKTTYKKIIKLTIEKTEFFVSKTTQTDIE